MDNDQFEKNNNETEYAKRLAEEVRQELKRKTEEVMDMIDTRQEKADKEYEQKKLLSDEQLSELDNMREALLKWENSSWKPRYKEEYEVLRKTYDEKWGNE